MKYTDRSEILSRQQPHEILSVPESATLDEIKAAYRTLVKIYHPDRSHEFVKAANAEVTKVINGAYEQMVKRAESRT